MTTKYYAEQNRIDKMRQQKADTPISISAKHTKTRADKPQYYCNYCQCIMVKMSEEEWFCGRCSISQYPDNEQLRSKSKISTPIGLNLEPCLSYLPEPDNLSKKPVEVKGGLAELKRRGIKVTSYKEGVG